MSVLDKLRKDMEAYAALVEESTREYDLLHGMFSILDVFAEAHPGLVDRTIHCNECGKPGPELPPEGWTGVWDPVQGELFTCPACAKEGHPR